MAAIRFDDRNFCIGTYVGTFCSMDDANDRLVTKNTSNGTVGTQYSLSPTLSSEILSLDYTGPRNLVAGQFNGPLPFYSLDASYIRYWELNNGAGNLVQSSSSANTRGYTSMAVEHYYTTFSAVTPSGAGHIHVNNSTYMSIGTKLLLGPSYGAGNDGSYEWAYVTAISGTDVYVSPTSSGSGLSTTYNYDTGNNITFSKYIYAFSSNGYLDKLDLSYNIISTTSGGLYSDVLCASWNNDYMAIGFVKQDGHNLLYTDPYQNYQILKSHTMMTFKADKISTWPVYGLTFDTSTIYRLQLGQTTVNDSGTPTDTTYGSSQYSYHQDTISPYTKNIAICASPSAITLNEGIITFTAVVRDQYGVGLLGKEVYFFESDSYGQFSPIGGMVTTNASGIATISYDLNKPGGDPTSFPVDNDIYITVRTNGASTLTGSQYVWDGMRILCKRKFISENDSVIRETNRYKNSDAYIDQITASGTIDTYITALSKFQFPGGDWTASGAPNDNATSIEQILSKVDDITIDEISANRLIDTYIDQTKSISKTGQVSQTYVSRHVSIGHQDSTTIDQFQFVDDAIPAFWSEKNPIDTNIWIRLRPFAYSLNQSRLVFKVKEISYAGDTGWIDVTSLCTLTTFDAGGGLLGIDALYNPSSNFHHGGMVYVDILVYDNAPVPNIIVTDYWFKIIPDYKSPYIVNESPSRGEENAPINTTISFDIQDLGVGVDISTLELYIGNRKKTPITTEIPGGYHILYAPTEDFSYGETVEVTVKVKDASGNENFLHDMWRFYVENSTGPWIDINSFYPRNCTKGVPRKLSDISFNVYGINNTGVDSESILVYIGGRKRDVTITPIIYRIS